MTRWLQAGGGLMLAVTLIFSGCASHREPKPDRTRFSATLAVVPAHVVGNHFIIECKWDKHGPWRFLVDTGSSVTVVTSEFARQYATDKVALDAPPVRVRSSNGDSQLLPAVTIKQIEMSDARFENVQALIWDLSDISAQLGVKIDGILGFPLFRDTVFTLDYPHSRLLINPSSDAPPYLPGETVHFNNNRRSPLIPVRVGEETIVVLLDSGSDGPLMLNPAGLSLNYKITPRPGAVVGTLSNDRTQEIGRLADQLAIGRYTFLEPVVDLTDNLSSLGGEILRHFSVTFNPSRNQVTFFRPSNAAIAPTPRRSSGLSFSKTPAYWRVAGVIPGSPADGAGIEAGDLVTRINREPVSAWSLQRFDDLVRNADEITFSFLEGQSETEKTVAIFDLVPLVAGGAPAETAGPAPSP